MKKKLFIVFILISMLSLAACSSKEKDIFDFKNLMWGMTQEEVKKIEENLGNTINETGMLSIPFIVNDNYLGLDAKIFYYFKGDECDSLCAISINYITTDKTIQQCYEDYLDIVEKCKKLYNEPFFCMDTDKNDINFENDDNILNLIKWETKTSIVSLCINDFGHKISFFIAYEELQSESDTTTITPTAETPINPVF